MSRINQLAAEKNDLLAKLQHHVNLLEETQRRFSKTVSISKDIDSSLPHGGLPLGCIHEVKGAGLAPAIAFASLLAARITTGYILHIASDRLLCPLGLLPYGIKLHRLIHVRCSNPQHLGWATLEALRCPQVSTVLSVMDCPELTACRRLQLAAEGSGATGFLLGNLTSVQAASPITRWRILPGLSPVQRFDELQWTIELSYCRGGRPGKWMSVWRNGELESTDSRHGVLSKPSGQIEIELHRSEALAG